MEKRVLEKEREGYKGVRKGGVERGGKGQRLENMENGRDFVEKSQKQLNNVVVGLKMLNITNLFHLIFIFE